MAMNLQFLACFACWATFISAAQADVIVIANRSRSAVRFEVAEGDRSDRQLTLDAERVVTLHAGQPIELTLLSPTGRAGGSTEAQQTSYRLALDAAYFFHELPNGEVELTKIGLGEAAGEADKTGPQAKNEPQRAALKSPQQNPPAGVNGMLKIPVKVLVDDEERAARRLWEDRLRKRVAATSQVFEQQFRISFEVIAVETWKSDNNVTDFDESRRQFKQAVDAQPARLALGFTSQYQVPQEYRHLGTVDAPLASHILIPESAPQLLEAERQELLVHELGHYLGAAHSPEADSAMRPVLGDRNLAARSSPISIDAVNSLAIALIAEQLRSREAASLDDLPLRKRQRLSNVYTTLLQVLPDDPVAASFLMLFVRPPTITAADADTPGQAPNATADSHNPPATVEVRLDSFVEATQEIIKAIVAAAGRNAGLAKAASGKRKATPLAGDELTNLYVRSAATAALQLSAEERGPAFFLGLALGLDRTERIRNYPVLGKLVERIEPNSDRERRLAVLGHPTWGGREDLALHFTFSAAITAMAGAGPAESAGLAKELADSHGKSGFSFVDWCADLAGIALTQRVQAGEVPLSLLASDFRTTDYLPEVTGLEEGLPRAEFDKRFGSTSDPRFQGIDDDIRRRIKQLYRRDD